MQYRDVIKGVYQGHEHLYSFEERNGIPYYIIGGGGADLYVPRDLGGFYHFIIVKVTPDDVSAEVRKISIRPNTAKTVESISPGALLESWENALFWQTWDNSIEKEISRDHPSEGKRALKVWFDTSIYEWPVLYLPLPAESNVTGADQMSIDVYVPRGLPGVLSITPEVEGKQLHSALPQFLKLGWNNVVVDLNDNWLPREEKSAARELRWGLSTGNKKFASWDVFDDFRVAKRENKARLQPKRNHRMTGITRDYLSEGWGGGLLWGLWGEKVGQMASSDFTTHGKQGPKVVFEISKTKRALLYSSLGPLWDLRRVGALAADVYVPECMAGTLMVNLILKSQHIRYAAPTLLLKQGWNRVSTDLTGVWLPYHARRAAEQVELVFSTSGEKLTGWVVVDNLRAEANQSSSGNR